MLGETSAVLGIDAVLVPAGTITGTVTADMTGEPLSGIYVCAMPVVEGLGACGFTRDDGTYGLHEVALGDHRVRFYDMNGDAYVDEYYDDVDDPDDATLVAVTVTGGVVAGIDAGLALKGAIEGTLSVDGGGPVGGGEVCALSAVGVIARCGHALSDGTYTIAGLNPGSYRVEIRANGPYVSEFYDDVFSYAEATPRRGDGRVHDDRDRCVTVAGRNVVRAGHRRRFRRLDRRDRGVRRFDDRGGSQV